MKIGLIDVDGHGGHPNLALMKISAYHKAKGDFVEWWNGFCTYDRVYMSKVFTFTPDIETVIRADEIIRGGTGYKDYGSLPPEIEGLAPDYSIYPQYDANIGFLTRGCIRNCPWCVVPRKEGYIHPDSTWQEIKRTESNRAVFLDNNVLAHEFGIEQIEQLGHERIWVDFNQGLDARLITPKVSKKLAKLHWIRFVRMSCDTKEMIPVIEQATAYLKEAGVAKSRFWSYVLVRDVQEAEVVVNALRDMGVTSFAQPYRDYDGGEPTDEQKHFAIWCNKKSVFNSCSWKEFDYRVSMGLEKVSYDTDDSSRNYSLW